MRNGKLLALIAALALAVTACSGGGNNGEAGGSQEPSTSASGSAPPASESSAPPSPSETKEFVFNNGDWPKPQDKRLAQFEQWKAKFEAENPGVTMKTENFSYDTNTFLPKAESGQLPNLFGTWFTEPQKIINAGYAADITEYMTKYGFEQALNPAMLDLVKKDGKIYGIPSNGYYMGIWYNVNLFKQAGLLDEKGIPKYPRTYEELAETAKIIKDKTGKAGFFFPTKNNQGGWEFMSIAWSYGAEFEKLENGKWKAVFNSPEAVEALQYLKDLKWKYDVLTDNVLVEVNDMFRMFGTDQVAMAFGGTDWMNTPINDYKMSKDNLSVSAVPAGPKGRVALSGGNLFMFSANSTPEQIDAGFKWLKIKGVSPDVNPESLKGLEETLASDQKLNRIVGPHGMQAWVNKERVDAENAIREKYKNVDLALWDDYMKNEGVTIRPEEPVNAQELYKTLDAVVQAVLTDKNADPKALLDKAAADFQRDYLDKAKG
ncbi:sugar ABC transporter substrate-binding protein [Cohnella xylanilytica]|uniref:ABC transporter substrate-binding protein n=1 Tax=Cohnella xylanilytica TaxID=557555 RepID=UPI001B25A9E6|nr:sugar ABC transporter substrate-binding protein [Cohnella xylanilytica]GIO13662.1 sugar ABC transporter substrate-binding protein [Cohnella xylanilytica]